ncbi:hypothetical protein AAC387_Pa03g1776 [Persea americana]
MNPLKCFFGVTLGKFPRCRPFSEIMKKGVTFKWSPECDATFRRLKEYLMKPLIQMAPVLERYLILYTRALDHSMGLLLAQKNDNGQELVSRINPLKVLMTKAGLLNPRMAKWSILLSHFDIEYVPQKAMKGQALADFLAVHLQQKGSQLTKPLQNELPSLV